MSTKIYKWYKFQNIYVIGDYLYNKFVLNSKK